MKYCIIIPDGMADYPIEKLGGRTPVETARTPNLDFLAQNGQLGVARTIPGGFPPGSDVANLSIVGYSPKEYYSGRAPLEAASIGIRLEKDDWAFSVQSYHCRRRYPGGLLCWSHKNGRSRRPY